MATEVKGNKPIEFVHAAIVFLLMFVFRLFRHQSPLLLMG